jgi:3-phenylpropionate/trans-cinnamate dioxygenase ferredoxin reductase component
VTDRHVDHLLIGGGIAAACAAQTLAAAAPEAHVLLVGRELDPPYHRPPISKGYLQGAQSRADALIDLPPEVEVLSGTSVLSVDTDARVATLSTKETVSYDAALIATGAMVRRLNVDGAGLDGVHYLRALGNADTLRADVGSASHVVLVGGSYIGCEVAASLTMLGTPTTIVMQEDEPFERSFGCRVGRYFRKVLESHGVRVIGGVEVAGFTPAEEGGERVGNVTLTDGRVVQGDGVVLGVGAAPDVMLARKAGLALAESGGIACDAQLRTSASAVWAAGDCCDYESVVHGERLRVEHEDHAAQQGAAGARNMLGAGEDYDVVPYFFSDLADWVSLEYVGPARTWAQEIFEGDVDGGAFSVRYLAGDGRLVAALSVGGAGDLDTARLELSGAAPSSPKRGTDLPQLSISHAPIEA